MTPTCSGSALPPPVQEILPQSGHEMTNELQIRESAPADAARLESLYPLAFPEEDLLPLVRELSRNPAIAWCFTGAIRTEIVAHVIFTRCSVAGVVEKAALLGPLAVAPPWQRRGIGTAMVREGLRRLDAAGVILVCVLGDPAYYGRLGFLPETLVEPPFALPPEWEGAWQSRYLGEAASRCAGKLRVPEPWLEPTLWAP